MRKYLFIALGAAVLALSCTKENSENAPVQKEWKLYARTESSRSVLNDDWSVSWKSGDALTVFNSDGKTYSGRTCFTISGDPADGLFTYNGSALLSGEGPFDWYVCAPYMQNGAAPDGTKGYTVNRTPTQNGYGTKAHLAADDLIAGKVLGLAADKTPTIALHHAVSLFKFTLKNGTASPVTFTGLTLDASQGGSYITGSFTMDWTGAIPKLNPAIMGSAKEYTSKLTIQNGTEVAPGGTADVYLCTAPFTIKSGKSINITISTKESGSVTLTKTFSKDMSFEAGKYNTATLSFEKEELPEEVVFIETFGTEAIGYANVNAGKYDKSGLKCKNPDDAANYVYSASGNASFAITGYVQNEFIVPAAVKLPAKAATKVNSAAFISNITVEPNTTYIFKYNKVKGTAAGVAFDTRTVFKWRQHGVSNFTQVNETTDSGTVEQEFTTGDYTVIDLGVEALDWNPDNTDTNGYPAVDLFQLIKK